MGEEVIVGIMCKSYGLSLDQAYEHFFAFRSDISTIILKNYDLDDLGLAKRFSWFEQINLISKSSTFEKIEKSIDFIKLRLIDSIKTHDIFHIDYLIAYYLEL